MATQAASNKGSMKKVVIAGMIGNGLEWYDYILYGHFAVILGKLFFPSSDPFISTMAVFGVFAAGFIMRPLGALFFGYLGDKYGRKTSLAASILLMAIPTGLLGLLPTYEQIGILAPILLTLIRLMQGAALGGEFSGSITYVVEHAPAHRRVLAGSTALISMMMGILIGSAVSAGVAAVLSPEDFESWGWRLPFIIGFFMGLIGLYIRSFLEESPEYEEVKSASGLSEKPVRELFSHYFKEIMVCTGLYMAVTIPFYMLTIYMKAFMTENVGYSERDSLNLNTISMLVVLAVIPLAAWIADKYGSKMVLRNSVIAMLFAAYPIFWLICSGDYGYALLGQLIFAVFLGFYISPIPAVFVNIFPIRVRYTGMAVACNLCAAVFGGTSPMVSSWLIKATGNNMAVAGYMIFACAVSLGTIAFLKCQHRSDYATA